MTNLFNVYDTNDYNYLLSMTGSDVIRNGTHTIRALITNTNLEQNFDDKRISSLSELKRGDLIHYDNNNFLIISEVTGKRYNKYKGLMRQCNYDIVFKTGEEEVITGYDELGRPIYETVSVYDTISTIVYGQYFDAQSGSVINVATGKINVSMQENDKTLAIKINDRFIKMGSAWNVVGLDRTQKGLITLTADKDIFQDDDDQENEIPNG